MDKKTEIQNLITSRRLSSDNEYNMFERALRELQGNLEVEDFGDVCGAFFDETHDDEVMFGLIHLIEGLRGVEYLREIAMCTPKMRDAHEWAMTLNKRIINSQEFFKMYISVIDSLDVDSKRKILELLNDVKDDNPKRFAEKIDYLNNSVMR